MATPQELTGANVTLLVCLMELAHYILIDKTEERI
jgi:hypothetical protein